MGQGRGGVWEEGQMVTELHLEKYESDSSQNRCLHQSQLTAGKCFIMPSLIERIEVGNNDERWPAWRHRKTEFC
jgi:hypothetical protein